MPGRRMLQLVAIATTLLAASLAHADKAPKLFVSPLKNFSVPIPDLAMGTKVQKKSGEHGGSVFFVGGTGDFRSIDYSEVPAVPPDSAALDTMIDGAILFEMQGTHAKILEHDQSMIGGTSVRFVSAVFPEGSAGVDMSSGKHMDAVRGMYSFVKGKFLYVLTAEPGGMFATTLAPEARSKNARRVLGEMLASMTFQ